MRTIYKFPLELGATTITVPRGSRVLAVQTQQQRLTSERAPPELPMLWMMVDTALDPMERTFEVHGTGHELQPGREYVGTFQMAAGAFVGHVFEVVV